MATENITSKVTFEDKIENETKNEQQNEEGNENEKTSYFWFAFNNCIFVYNSYVIANNLSVKDGYFFILVALVVNVAIGMVYKDQFISLFPKLNKSISISYMILGVGLIIGLIFGVMPFV